MHLSRAKCLLFAKSMECLGHVIDDRGLHADVDKMSRVRNWPTPKNYNDVQRFLGLVQYLAHFMPNVSAYTSPLSGMTRNGQPFAWRPLHDKCFEQIKVLACKTPILRPINPDGSDPIWVITDASTSGVGASRTCFHEAKRSRRRPKARSRLRSLVDWLRIVRTSSSSGSRWGAITTGP